MSEYQITFHYVDGKPSETRPMTAEEIALLPKHTDALILITESNNDD